MGTRGHRRLGGMPSAALRPILAAFGLVVCAVAAALLALAGASYGVVLFFAVLAVIAIFDLAARRRRTRAEERGEPG